jgi:hypothetical protein
MDEWERICLPVAPDGLVQARAAVGSSLRTRACAPPMVAAAELLVQEAVAAVMHAGDVDGPERIWVRWGRAGCQVRFEVHDPGRLGAEPACVDRRVVFGGQAERVSELADDWGSEPVEHGQLLWCALHIDGCDGEDATAA